jgi:DNA (cytosine-5)-methyltransferase 1
VSRVLGKGCYVLLHGGIFRIRKLQAAHVRQASPATPSSGRSSLTPATYRTRSSGVRPLGLPPTCKPLRRMTFGSLFAGIGGLDLGLERAGLTCRWQVEIDDYCQRVLTKHWPDVLKFRDVREVGAHNLEPVDVICGGFPCQDVSTAGRGAGIAEGTRSGLWRQFARIISELQPKFVLIENVPGLRTKGLDIVLQDLADADYDAEGHPVTASAFGLDHKRERLFIVAYPAGVGCEEPRFDWTHPDDRKTLQSWEANHVVDALRRGTLPYLCREDHGVSGRVDRLRGLGNAVVPQAAEWVGRRLLDAEAKCL